jgi:hypothetical protein
VLLRFGMVMIKINIALIRAGKTYANVHSSKFPLGEIRSQIDPHDGNDDHGTGH